MSQDRLEGLERLLDIHVDAVTRILDQNRGDWGNGMFYSGGYEAVLGEMVHGGVAVVTERDVTELQLRSHRSPHRQPHDAPQPGADGHGRGKPRSHRHAQDRPRRGLRRMRRRRVVAVVGVAMMVMVMTLAVGMGVSHGKMLYYNIT